MRSIRLKKIIAVAMIFVMGASVYGCTGTNASGSKNDDVVVEDSNSNNDGANDETVVEDEEENNEQISNTEENSEDKSKVEVFKLYSKDAEQGAEINLGEVEIN